MKKINILSLVVAANLLAPSFAVYADDAPKNHVSSEQLAQKVKGESCSESDTIVDRVWKFYEKNHFNFTVAGFGGVGTGVAILGTGIDDYMKMSDYWLADEVREKAVRRVGLRLRLAGAFSVVGFGLIAADMFMFAKTPDHITLANNIEQFIQVAVTDPATFCTMVKRYPKVMTLATSRALAHIQNKEETHAMIAEYRTKPHLIEPVTVQSDNTRVIQSGVILQTK